MEVQPVTPPHGNLRVIGTSSIFLPKLGRGGKAPQMGGVSQVFKCPNKECCCSSTLGSENSRRSLGLVCAGRSNAATKARHWSASNKKRRWSATVCSASVQALRTMKSVKLSPRSWAARRISSSCCAEVLRFSRRDRGSFKVEGITSYSVHTLYALIRGFGRSRPDRFVLISSFG